MNKITEDTRYNEPKGSDNFTFLPLEDFNSLTFHSPLTDDNPRLVSQAGLFTISMNEHSITEWVQTHYNPLTDDWILMKADIDAGKPDRMQMMRQLNRMNINHATLFPDLEGAAKYAVMQLSIKDY